MRHALATLAALTMAISVNTARAWESMPVPGGIAVFDLSNKTLDEAALTTNLGRPVSVVSTDNGQFALAGIPLDVAVAKIRLLDDTREVAAQTIIQRPYREQRLRIKERKYVEPDTEQLARYRREKAEMDAARASNSASDDWRLPWSAPVPGKQSDSFGARRFFNDQPRNPHSGMDIAAPAGTAVQVPSDGVIVATGHYFFNGKTVMVDHGQGLVTLYCHLEEISVEQGVVVKTGTTIGRVGATGRVTGAHLHWSVYLRGVAVDPAWFLGRVWQPNPVQQVD